MIIVGISCVCVPFLHKKWKNPTTPLMGVQPGNPLGATWPSRIDASPRGDGGRVSAARRVPPNAPPLYRSLGSGWANERIRLTGAPLFTCPSEQNKFRGSRASTLSVDKTNKRGNNTLEPKQGEKQEGRSKRKLRIWQGFWTAAPIETCKCSDCNAKYFK